MAQENAAMMYTNGTATSGAIINGSLQIPMYAAPQQNMMAINPTMMPASQLVYLPNANVQYVIQQPYAQQFIVDPNYQDEVQKLREECRVLKDQVKFHKQDAHNWRIIAKRLQEIKDNLEKEVEKLNEELAVHDIEDLVRMQRRQNLAGCNNNDDDFDDVSEAE